MNQEEYRAERSSQNCSRFSWASYVTSAWQRLLAGAVVVLALAASTPAQNSTGRIIGIITDPQGAAVLNARVTVTNIETNVRWNATTNDTGAYQVLDLPIGMYSVAAEIEGFSKVLTQPQELTINQSLRVDFHLKVGAISEVVSVQSQTIQVETVNPTVGGTVTGRPIQALPLNGRETLDLALTQPGVAPAPTTGYGSEKSGDGGFDQGFTVAGGRPDAITYLLDGNVNNQVTSSNVAFDPNPDAVAEFRILVNNYTAEYGRSGGGTVSVVTKSGTNQLHGSLFDYLRNDAFNANDFFDKQKGNARPVLKRNQFGGTIGGPITIPHVVNGKDKLFFFFAYEGQRQSRIENQGSIKVFTPAQLNGDFSGDPNVAAFLQSYPYFQSDPNLAARGIIDPTKIDPVAQNYIDAKLIPSSPSGTIFPTGRATNNLDQYTGKVDWYATQSDRFSLTIGAETAPSFSPFTTVPPPNIAGYPENTKTTNDTASLAYLKTFSGTMLNEAHLTATRWYYHDDPVSNPLRPVTLGVNIGSDAPYGPPFLHFNSGMSVGFNPNLPNKRAENIYTVSDTLTRTKGKHTWKVGGRFSIIQENSVYLTSGNGNFDFGTFGGSGNDLADFLFGNPDNYTQFAQAHNNEHQRQWSAFLQDEWKVSPRLVLTLGLRYEYTSPETDTKGHTFSVIPGLHTARFTDAPPGLVVPGDKGAPKGWYFPDYKNFAPRVGFAFDPFADGKTSIRGGVGMFYDTMNAWMANWNDGNPPWFGGAAFGFNPIVNGPNTLLSDPYGAALFGPAVDPFPDPYPNLPPPPGYSVLKQGVTFPYGIGVAFVNPHLKTPYIYQYNLSVERQLGNGLLLDVGYVGSSSHKLITFVDENPFNPKTGNRILNDLLGLNPFVNGYGSHITFDGKTNANYNGLLASLTKSTGNVPHLGSMFFTLSYTYSHNLDDGSGFNQRSAEVPFFNPHQFYSNSDFDQRHRLVFSGGWDLPFAEMWVSGPKKLTKGWSLYPIAYFQSGIPLDLYLHPPGPVPPVIIDPVSGSGSSSGYGDPQLERPNQLTSVVQTLDPRRTQTINGATGNFYFNPADFAPDPCIAANTCPIGFYGTFQRNSIVGPRRVNFDLALEKATDLVGERLKVLFRVEAFNILNHAQFINPGNFDGGNFGAGTVGQVTQTYDPRILQLSLRLSF